MPGVCDAPLHLLARDGREEAAAEEAARSAVDRIRPGGEARHIGPGHAAVAVKDPPLIGRAQQLRCKVVVVSCWG